MEDAAQTQAEHRIVRARHDMLLEPDRLELSPEALGSRGTTELVAQPDARNVEARMGILEKVGEGQRKAVAAEIVIEIFEPPDPIAGERIFPPAANGPAGMSRRRE